MKADVEALEKYGFCDPASGRGKLKKSRARQARIMIGVDHLMRVFVLFSWAGRMPTSKLRDAVLDDYEKWQPRRYGIESNAMQELFGDLVIDEGQKRMGHVRIVPVPSPTKIEKDFKIRTTIEPVANEGRLFVPESMIELRAEIFGFPTAAYKDLVDCLAMAIMLVPKRHPQEQRNDEREARLAYLRNSGAPPGYIEKVSQEVMH